MAYLTIPIDENEIPTRRRERLVALSRRPTATCKRKELMDRGLHTSAKKADVDAFIRDLEDYSSCNRISLSDIFYQLSPGKNTLLHVAVANVKDDIVSAIIDFLPVDLISRENSKGDTALHIAARAGSTRIVELILGRGKVLRRSTRSGNNALHEAVRNRHYEVIQRVVRANANTLCHKNREAKSPLYLAVETGELQVLNLLLEAPINGDTAPEIQGLSPVHATVMHQKLEMMVEMWNKKPWQRLFQMKDARDGTPLHLASYSNYLEGVKFLIERFPTSALEYDKDGNLPIHVACKMDHVQVINVLLQKCLDPTEFHTRQGQNILHVSAKHGSTATVKYIVADPRLEQLINEKDKEGNSALHLATMNWKPETLLVLARNQRVDLKLVNKDNMTAVDLVDERMKGINEPLHERLTRIILASAGTPKSRDLGICRPTGRDFSKELEPPDLDRLKKEANNRMIVATFVAGTTFATGFTIPGGFNGSNPDAGMSTLLNRAMFQVFVICNILAMYSSVIALVILLWTQMNDPHTVRYALLKARAPLLLSLLTMSGAFMAGVYVTTSKLAWLSILVLIIGIVALIIILGFYLLLYVPLRCTNPLVRRFIDFIIVVGISMSRGPTEKSLTEWSARGTPTSPHPAPAPAPAPPPPPRRSRPPRPAGAPSAI